MTKCKQFAPSEGSASKNRGSGKVATVVARFNLSSGKLATVVASKNRTPGKVAEPSARCCNEKNR